MRFFQVIFGSSVDFQPQPADFINRRELALKFWIYIFLGIVSFFKLPLFG